MVERRPGVVIIFMRTTSNNAFAPSHCETHVPSLEHDTLKYAKKKARRLTNNYKSKYGLNERAGIRQPMISEFTQYEYSNEARTDTTVS